MYKAVFPLFETQIIQANTAERKKNIKAGVDI